MKKFYAFFAAALVSVCAFASKDQVPSDEVLAEYYEQGKVCMCFFVPADMNCNDIVVTGSFNGFKPAEGVVPVEPVEGYDGWYVASWEPEAEPDENKGIQAKPVMLEEGGGFNWEYQVGAATVIRGGVQVRQGLPGEIDLTNYGTDAPNVFTVDAWKQNPCTAIYHNYTVTVISNGCDGAVVPFIAGAMNSWSFQEMQLDVEKTNEYQIPTYTWTFKAAEGTPYQILSGLMGESGEIETQPNWDNADSYLQTLVEGVWTRYEPDNSFLGENVNIVYDLREETMRWARCDDTPTQYTIVTVKLPLLNRPEAVEIIGTFDGWAGTAMELHDNGYHFVELDAKPSQYFKFRSAGLWPNEGGTELEIYNTENDEWGTIGDGQLTFGQLWVDDTYKNTPCKRIDLDDWSDPELYRWQVKGEEGIENVVLTEKAKKVIVDGVMYIVRDGKMFNVQGAQVR